MAEYGLFCAKLRREGFDVVADLIEKLQAERDTLEQERDKLLAERDALTEIVKSGRACQCVTCKHVINQNRDTGCMLWDEEDCSLCARSDCNCKECVCGSEWELRGEQE